MAGATGLEPAEYWTSGHSYRPNPPAWIRCAMPTSRYQSRAHTEARAFAGRNFSFVWLHSWPSRFPVSLKVKELLSFLKRSEPPPFRALRGVQRVICMKTLARV